MATEHIRQVGSRVVLGVVGGSQPRLFVNLAVASSNAPLRFSARRRV